MAASEFQHHDAIGDDIVVLASNMSHGHHGQTDTSRFEVSPMNNRTYWQSLFHAPRISRLRVFAMLFLLGMMAVTAMAAPSDTTMQVPPPGVHPRILFTREEMPQIREQAKTPLGKQFLDNVRWQTDYPDKDLLAKLAKGEPTKVDPDGLIGSAYFAAAAYLFTEDQKYLDSAKAFLNYWTQRVSPLPTKPEVGFSRAYEQLALTYDWLYNDLSPEQRNVMRDYMGLRIDAKTNRYGWQHAAYGRGPSNSGRGCDWAAIWSAGCTLMCLALEGEHPNATPAFLNESVNTMKWIADYSLTSDGLTPNGNGYAGTDFVSYFNALHALQRRGIFLIDHPNIQAMPSWLAYELVPGCYCYDNRNQSNGILALNPTIVNLAVRFDGVAPWLQELALGPERRIGGDPMGSVDALLYGRFPTTPPTQPALPLSRWLSTMGTVYSRSGWSLADSSFTVTMEPPGQTHTHPDKGSFTFYAHGLMLAGDSGTNAFQASEHNSILIDGKGQLDGQGVTDAVVRAYLASDLADMTYMDVQSAYESRLAYTETDGKANWENIQVGKGLPLQYDKLNALHHANRYAIYVRGLPEAYAVVLDDIQKDDAPHRYQWYLHGVPSGEVQGKDVRYRSRYGGKYYQVEVEKPATFHATIPAEGNYAVWVLGRARPDLRNFNWFCIANINGTFSRSFYLQHYTYDWQWMRVTRGEKPEDALWKLPAGDAKINLSLKRGGRIAQVMVSRDANFVPNGEVEASADQILATIDPAAIQSGNWSLAQQADPQVQMDLIFLQPTKENLAVKFDTAFKGRNFPETQLIAEQQTARAGYAAIMLPSLVGQPGNEMIQGPVGSGQMTVKHGDVVDYLYANPSNVATSLGKLQSDGKFALVRQRNGTVIGYLLVAGSTLKIDSQELVKASAGPVYLVNDGKTCAVNAPQGTVITASSLGTTTARVNNQPLSPMVQAKSLRLNVPVLQKTWDISFSKDGSVVTIVGDGPTPLKVQAPKATQCLVNGVSVYFSRADGGYIYPKLDVTVPSHGDGPVAD